MIIVTRFDRQTMFLNPDHIVSIEETPDTVITLYNGNHILVREKCQAILSRIVAFKTMIIRRSGAVQPGQAYLRRQRTRALGSLYGQQSQVDDRNFRKPLHHQDI